MQDLAFHSYKREQRLTLKAGWSVLKKLPFFTWERMCPPPFFLRDTYSRKSIIAETCFCHCCSCRWHHWQLGMKDEQWRRKKTNKVHPLHSTASCYLHFHSPDHKGVLSPSNVLQNHFVWSMVCASLTPQNHKDLRWPLDPSPQQTGLPYASLDCQNVDRNVVI